MFWLITIIILKQEYWNKNQNQQGSKGRNTNERIITKNQTKKHTHKQFNFALMERKTEQ